jgi:hypothetical protein
MSADVIDFLRRHVYTRYTTPIHTQLRQREYGYALSHHRQARSSYCRIEEPIWRDYAAEAEAAEEADEADIDRADDDAEMLEFAY